MPLLRTRNKSRVADDGDEEVMQDLHSERAVTNHHDDLSPEVKTNTTRKDKRGGGGWYASKNHNKRKKKSPLNDKTSPWLRGDASRRRNH
eukprot:scaffold4803_cov144-Amphora_coffeaeformis.AAC.5